MKISLDFDGTTWQHQEFFIAFMKAMQAAGHQVGMLTGHHEKIRERDIDLMIKRGFPRPDFWLGRPNDSKMHGGSFKPRAIEEHGIDYHFDDCDFSQPRCIDLMGDHPRLFRVWHEKPKGSHVTKPPLPTLPPVYPPGCDTHHT